MGQCVESFRVHASLACICESLKKEKTRRNNQKTKRKTKNLSKLEDFKKLTVLKKATPLKKSDDDICHELANYRCKVKKRRLKD